MKIVPIWRLVNDNTCYQTYVHHAVKLKKKFLNGLFLLVFSIKIFYKEVECNNGSYTKNHNLDVVVILNNLFVELFLWYYKM